MGGYSKAFSDCEVLYQLDESGLLHASEVRDVTHADTVSELSAEGFRLPTSDEWEYACAAGSRTLFRWGAHCPPGAVSSDPRQPTARTQFHGGVGGSSTTQPILELGRGQPTEERGLQSVSGYERFRTSDLWRHGVPGILHRARHAWGGDCGTLAMEMDRFTGLWLPSASSFFSPDTNR